MKIPIGLMVALMITLSACQGLTATDNVVSIYKSPSLALWYNRAEECAGSNHLTLQLVADPQAAQISFYFGRVPEPNSNPVYQVGSGSLVVVGNQKELEILDQNALVKIITNSTQQELEVWVYPAGDDIQNTFEMGFLNGQKPSPSTKLALTTERMIQALLAPTAAIGILPANVVPTSLITLYTLENVPVLATSPQTPSGNLALLYQCLENDPTP